MILKSPIQRKYPQGQITIVHSTTIIYRSYMFDTLASSLVLHYSLTKFLHSSIHNTKNFKKNCKKFESNHWRRIDI